MKVLIAIDSFKGSLSSSELADIIEDGLHQVSNKLLAKKVPVADGGEGTIDALLNNLGGKKIEVKVKGPLFEDIIAKYAILDGNTAVIEMAEAAGLTLLPDRLRNPMKTTTYGVGQLLSEAIGRGCRDFIISLGGSATNDAGIGMLNALGYKFFDKTDNELAPIGASLIKITRIDSSKALQTLSNCHFTVACDVDNPFYGPKGAAHTFAGQKGAAKEEVLILDRGLKNFSELIIRERNTDISLPNGAGAAGGLGGGLKAFLNAELKPGIEVIFDKIHLEEKIKWADIIITGEGRLDHQTTMGKVPAGVAALAQKHKKPLIALAGSVTDDAIALHNLGVTSMFSIMDRPMTLDEAMAAERTRRLVKKQVIEIFRLVVNMG
jgi:glycerate 2-kinase